MEKGIMKRKDIDIYSGLPYNAPEFVLAWEDWVEFRRKLGHPYRTQMGISKQFKVFTSNNMTYKQAIECIEHAIGMEWRMAFPLKFYKNGTSSGTAIGNSFAATEQAFANLQRNIDQAMRPNGHQDRHA
jgi:hypothetical protein